MKTMNYTETRRNLASVFDSVTDDREEVIVSRAGHEDVVIVARDEYESMKETLYLMRSPVNAAMLRESIAELRAGKGTVRELIDE